MQSGRQTEEMNCSEEQRDPDRNVHFLGNSRRTVQSLTQETQSVTLYNYLLTIDFSELPSVEPAEILHLLHTT